MRTNDNKPGGRDLVGHSGVQAWSAGRLFPAVIKCVESYRVFATLSEWWIEHPDNGFLTDTHLAQYERERVGFYTKPLDDRLRHRSWVVIYPGEDEMRFSCRGDAEEAAGALVMRDAMVMVATNERIDRLTLAKAPGGYVRAPLPNMHDLMTLR